jgi:hypothetical protein
VPRTTPLKAARKLRSASSVCEARETRCSPLDRPTPISLTHDSRAVRSRLTSIPQDLYSKVGPPPRAVNDRHGSYIVPVTCTSGRSNAPTSEFRPAGKVIRAGHCGMRRLAAAFRRNELPRMSEARVASPSAAEALSIGELVDGFRVVGRQKFLGETKAKMICCPRWTNRTNESSTWPPPCSFAGAWQRSKGVRGPRAKPHTANP